MPSFPRRMFLRFAAAAAAAPQAGAQNSQPEKVYFAGDGLNQTPAECARLLAKVAGQDRAWRDSYLKDGPVRELETRMAALLGKERAIFLPTGTLANHLAVRLLAGENRKVLVQQESHLYRDEGDCAQLLSGLNLVPLAPGRATFTVEEMRTAMDQAAGPPYPAPVGAISVESPVRRTMGQVFDFEEMKKVCAYARERKIGAHLDGARMFLASAYTGISPAQYSALFDTVYVSLYKYFNAPFGAILAGPASLIERAETLRHQFGSMICQGWQSAAVALHYLEGFADRFQTAARNGDQLIQLLERSRKFRVERVAGGTNIAWLERASGAPLGSLRERLDSSGIVFTGAKDAVRGILQINETINRRSPDEIARAFAVAAG